MKQHRRIVPGLLAAVVALVVVISAVTSSASSTPSGTAPRAAAAVSSSASSTSLSFGSMSAPASSVSSAAPPNLCGIPSVLCPIPIDYYAPFDSTNPPDPTLCQQPWNPPSNASSPPPSPCHIDLRGVLYLPHNKRVATTLKNQPLIIFVHGSTLNNGVPNVSAMATDFTKAGFAFFALHRRGHGDSTGQNLDGVPANPDCGSPSDCTISTIANLCIQIFEVRQALIAMKALRNGAGQPIIDQTRIALLGHSLGGIVTLCANTQQLGLRTVIDIAAGSESWNTYDAEDGVPGDDQGPAITVLNTMVAQHVTPPMFLQPMNDCSTKPTGLFGRTVADQNEPYDATIFPDVTVNTTPPYGPPIPQSQCKTAHPNFVFVKHWVDEWTPSAIAWINRWFVDPSTINTAQPPPN